MEHNNYKRKVERLLYSYPALLAAIENDTKYNHTMPTITASYGDFVGGGDNNTSKTEKYAIMRADKQLRIDAIERGLKALTYTEKDLITEKYFNPAQLSNDELCLKIGIGRTTFYKFKEQALMKMAIALNII